MTVQLAEVENTYAAAFRELTEKHANEPSWLRELRQSAFQQFASAGFPGVDLEEWKYTNVAPIARTKFRPVLAANGTQLAKRNAMAPFTYTETRDSAFVFVNGIFRKDLSSRKALPEDVIALDLGEALQRADYETSIRESLEHYGEANSFTLLNTALFAGGLFIKIPAHFEVGPAIQLQFISEPVKGDAPAAAFPRVLIIGERNSAATIVESYGSSSDGAYFTNAVIDLVLREGAGFKHYKVQRESIEASHV